MQTSPTIGAIAAALASAQAEMKNASLNKVNPHFKSKYADLAEIRDTVVPALSKHGIAVIQSTHVDGSAVVVDTILAHSSGEFISGSMPVMVPDRATAQAMGSGLTYARRYALAAIACISADEDDDANAASDATKQAPAAPAKPWRGPLKTTALKTAIREFGRDLEACCDRDSLDALLLSSKAILEQCEVDLPEWWGGTADFGGCAVAIEKKKAELAAPAPLKSDLSDDMAVWLEQFKSDLSSAPTHLAAQDIWTSAKDQRAFLKREHPVVYADLENWTKATIASKSKDAA